MQRAKRQRRKQSREGIALVLAITSVAILAVMLADLHDTTGTSYAISTSSRDALQAELLAQSAIDLTRLMVATGPLFQQVAQSHPLVATAYPSGIPPLPMWKYANALIAPFCSGAKQVGGFDFGSSQGLEELPGKCEIIGVTESAKIKVNGAIQGNTNQMKQTMAQTLFALMDGNQAESPYDPLFSELDRDGQRTSRSEVLAAVIDWWDADEFRTDYDAGSNQINNGGSEDNRVYQDLKDRFTVKNAPFDSIAELHLLRGFGDDFWATFVEPVPNDLEARVLTIYGSGGLDVNEASAQALLAQICVYLPTEAICTDYAQAAGFIGFINLIRATAPGPLFSNAGEFLDFIEGNPSSTSPLQTALNFAGGANGPINPANSFQGVTIPAQVRPAMQQAFKTSSGGEIVSLRGIGHVGRSKVQIDSVVNFRNNWQPPAPNTAISQRLGVFHYYRVQ